MVLLTAQNEDGCRPFGSLCVDLELEKPSYVLENIFPRASCAVYFEEVVGVNVFDLLDVKQVLPRVVLDVDCAICSDGFVQILFVALEFLFTVVQDTVVRHVKDDECVWEQSLSLQGQSLYPSAWVAGEDEALAVFLDGLNFLTYHLCDYIIADHCEMA